MTDPFAKPTMSINDAATILGISRNGAYAAAKRGEIPTIRIGGRVMVISAKLREMTNAGATSPADPTLLSRIATAHRKQETKARKDEASVIEMLADIITERIMQRLESES